MERVLIVAKTHMNNAACVSGLTIETNKGIRLLRSNGFNQQIDTKFEVGQVWELDFHPASKIISPHIEDVIVTRERFIGQYTNLVSLLMERVQPWQGEPDQLFDGLLIVDRTSAYISKSRGIPNCSTGYWLPNSPLNLTQKNEKSYYQIMYETHNPYQGTLSIRYVGFTAPIQHIPAHTLIRVSLARWWMPTGVDDERCYLQLSGWYV